MSTTIKRSDFATFLNHGTYGTPAFDIIGDGVTAATLNYNPETLEETYIHQDSGTTEVQSYKPNFPIEATAKNTDPTFEFIDNLRKTRAVGSAAQSDVVNVWMYETGGPTAYPAERQLVSIQIDSFGGDGGAATKINYTINFLGAPIPGTFNASTKAFTPT